MTGVFHSELAHFRRFCGDDRGATAAEFGLVVGFFFILVFSTINFSLAMYALVQIHYAAERTARCISVDTTGVCNTTATVDSFAKSWYRGAGLSTLTFTATAPACGNKVVGTGSFPVMLGLSKMSVTLSASACYPLI